MTHDAAYTRERALALLHEWTESPGLLKGAALLGIPVEEHVANCLKAMQDHAAELGLGGCGGVGHQRAIATAFHCVVQSRWFL